MQKASSKHTKHSDKYQSIWYRIWDDIEIGSVIAHLYGSMHLLLFVFALLFIAIEGCVHVSQLFLQQRKRFVHMGKRHLSEWMLAVIIYLQPTESSCSCEIQQVFCRKI